MALRTLGSRLLCFVLGAFAIVSVRAEETVGPHTIATTPASAVLVAGGGASFNWLNVTDSPISINTAFTGFSVIDDGYGNAQSGTVLRLTFAPGALINHVGPDLVLLDAGLDLNQYRVRTSYDGFSQEILVNASSDTGVDRGYFFGGSGPTMFDIFAGTIELSSLNVPEGYAVDQVQLFTEGPSNDPLALGVLVNLQGACAAAVEQVSGLRVLANKADLSWDPSVNAVGYDIVKGDLLGLRNTSGDFTSSLTGCVENASPDAVAPDASIPTPGGGFYYVVRYQDACNNFSTFDSGSPSQQGSRDAEIGASPLDCEGIGCSGQNPSSGHCGTNQDCFPGDCVFTGCTPSRCFCSQNFAWICSNDCLGHCE